MEKLLPLPVGHSIYIPRPFFKQIEILIGEPIYFDDLLKLYHSNQLSSPATDNKSSSSSSNSSNSNDAIDSMIPSAASDKEPQHHLIEMNRDKARYQNHPPEKKEIWIQITKVVEKELILLGEQLRNIQKGIEHPRGTIQS